MLERRQVTHHFKPERKLEPNNITNLNLCLSFSNYHALRQTGATSEAQPNFLSNKLNLIRR